MQQNNPDGSRIHLHYSPNAYNSLGVVAQQFKDISKAKNDALGVGVQWNRLLLRRNTSSSQANIYSKVNIGHSEQFNNNTYAQFDIAADWETRRIFTSYEVSSFYRNNQLQFEQSARVGIAPYLGNYGDLHTWLMLQLNHHPADQSNTSLTPVIRLFKGDYLAELGVEKTGDITFNWIVRF